MRKILFSNENALAYEMVKIIRNPCVNENIIFPILNRCLGNIPFFYDYLSFFIHVQLSHILNCIFLLFVSFFAHLLLIFVISLSILVFVKGYRNLF